MSHLWPIWKVTTNIRFFFSIFLTLVKFLFSLRSSSFKSVSTRLLEQINCASFCWEVAERVEVTNRKQKKQSPTWQVGEMETHMPNNL